MIQAIDRHKLNLLRSTAGTYASTDALRREGKIFFIGGNLPLYSTLETMYESYCQESSELFHVTFGDAGQFEQNLDMVRQIKRNFSIRLMGRIAYPLSAEQVERTYLGGLDLLDLPFNADCSIPAAESDRQQWQTACASATDIFTRWSVFSSINPGAAAPQAVRARITELLSEGVVPLLEITADCCDWFEDDLSALYSFLAAEWHHQRVALKPVMPLLRLISPFVLPESGGYLRDVIDKLQDRRILASSDLRRHLRTSAAEASFESAGL